MKQIILNITTDEQNNAIAVINCTKADGEKIVRVLQQQQMTNRDKAFIENLKQLITENYGN